MKSDSELRDIGTKIFTCFNTLEHIVETLGLTQEDLAEFAAYLNRMDTSLPIADPTEYRDVGRDAIQFSRERVEVLQKVLPLCILWTGRKPK